MHRPLRKFALWISGAIVIVAGIFIAAIFLKLLWLIPLPFFIAAGVLWRYHHRWIRIALICAGAILTIVIVIYDVYGRANHQESQPSPPKPSAMQTTYMLKPPAGAPKAMTMQVVKLEAKLEKATATIARLQMKENNHPVKAVTIPPQSTEETQPPRANLPLSGDKGIIVPIMYDCYYSAGDVVTCEGSVQNTDDVEHGVYLMDSQGVVNTQTGGEQFSVWTFGGSIQFTGGTDFARLIPGMQSPFVFSFREHTGKAEYVGITLFLKSAADSINHEYTFANIRVRDH